MNLFKKYVLSEIDKTKDIDVILLYDRDDWTIGKILPWCNNNSIKYNQFNINKVVFDKSTLIEENNKSKIGKDTIIIVRSSNLTTFALNLLSKLENYFIINNLDSINICSNNYILYNKINDLIRCPKVNLIYNNEVKINKFPILVKVKNEEFIIESEKSLNSILNILFKLNNNEIIIQEYIESLFISKVYIIGKNVVSSIAYNKNRWDNFEIKEETKKQLINVINKLNLTWCCVNLMYGLDNQPYLNSIDTNPDLYITEQSSKINIIDKLMNYLVNKNNWPKKDIICGYNEVIDISNIGKVISKFNTGSESNIIYCDSIKEDNGNVTWNFNNKILTNKIKKYVKLSNNKNKIIIDLDIEFNGKYNDEFILEDKKSKIGVSLSRNFMQQANILINPSKTFLVSKE
jgi:glutathione synthase/RimK-type ligase-like ATP-grasp enzyme